MRLLQSVRIKRLATTVAFVFAVVVGQFSTVQFASAAPITWDGSADALFSTDANWSGDAAPVAGDVVILDGAMPGTLTNDLGVNLAGITVSSGSYTIDTVALADGATISVNGSDASLTITGAVTGAGSVIVSNTAGSLDFSGAVSTVGSLTVSGVDITFAAVTTGTDLSVAAGGTVFNGAVAVGGNATLTGPTIDTGSTFATTGNLTVSGTAVTLNGGAVTVGGDLSYTGTADNQFGALNVTGDLSVNGTGLQLAAVTVGGNATIVGTYSQSESIASSSALDVTGNLSISGFGVNLYHPTVTVGGNATILVSLYGNTVYTIAGDVTLGDSALYSYGTLNLADGTDIAGTLTVAYGVMNQVLEAEINIGNLVVNNGATARLSGTHAFPITFGSGQSTASPSLLSNSSDYPDYTNLELTGDITLLNNLRVSVGGNGNGGQVEISGDVEYNDFTITKANGSSGTLIVGGVEIVNAVTTNEYNGDQPSDSISVYENETAILNGVRNGASVSAGGILKGTGTLAGTLYVEYGGIVNPGNSPGKLTVLSTLYMEPGAIYQAELLNADSYDQLAVGEEYAGSGNAVTLGSDTESPELDVFLFDGYDISEGDEFTIINNLSDTDVLYTFAGMDEGTQFTIGDIVFSISYVGGDGNDVVITALNEGVDPTPPNTGVLQIALANPAIVAGLGILAAAILVFGATRRRQNS